MSDQSTTDWAQHLGDNELLCRDLGHTWQPHAAGFNKRTQSYHQALRCGRCTTIRTRLLSRTGEILASSYQYPDNYLVPAGIGRVDASFRGELRVLSINRIIDAASRAAAESNTTVTNITSKKRSK